MSKMTASTITSLTPSLRPNNQTAMNKANHHRLFFSICAKTIQRNKNNKKSPLTDKVFNQTDGYDVTDEMDFHVNTDCKGKHTPEQQVCARSV
jgi:hypothetical protein